MPSAPVTMTLSAPLAVIPSTFAAEPVWPHTVGANGLCKLNGHHTHATARSEHQHAIQRTELGTTMQRYPGGDPGNGHRRDLGEVEAGGNREQPTVGDRDLAAVQTGANDSETAATHEHSTSVDVARGLQAGCPRQVGSGRADRTLRDPHVERIDGRNRRCRPVVRRDAAPDRGPRRVGGCHRWNEVVLRASRHCRPIDRRPSEPVTCQR